MNPIKPHRAMFLCDQKKKECAESRICGTLCKHTTDVNHAKHGPVVNVREWEQRFNIENQNGLLVYVEKTDECKDM